VLGSKQWGRLVGFGSYTYNTAEGGGFGATFGRHTATAGVGFLKPAGVRGEIGFGAIWMHPLNGELRDQYGAEIYWKLLFTPSLWVTPGVQFIVDPSLNPGTDFVTIGHIKFRLFF
jgi:carbohydrate-selective porin OprB